MAWAGRRAIVDGLVLLALGLTVAAGYRYWQGQQPVGDLVIQPESGCDLQRASCLARLPDGGTVTLGFAPQPVPLLKPFTVDVATRGLSAQSVTVDFSGADMDMGLNRVVLQAAGDGRHAGQATLPVCVTGRMTWKATVFLETGRQRLAIPYRFVAER